MYKEERQNPTIMMIKAIVVRRFEERLEKLIEWSAQTARIIIRYSCAPGG